MPPGSLLDAPVEFHHAVLVGISEGAEREIDGVVGVEAFAEFGAGPTPRVTPEVGGNLHIRSATHIVPDFFLGHSQGIGFEADFFVGRPRMKGRIAKKKREKNGIDWHGFKVREESNFVESIGARYLQTRRSRMANRYVPMLGG